MAEQRPFKIQIFVAEGMPDGLRFVEKSNWIGLGIVCPRGRYPEVKNRDEFSLSGVYMLVGQDGHEERPTIYVGEAETVKQRLDRHHAEKDFWQKAIIFTTKGDPLNKAQVQYLEARLFELAQKNKRCRLDNSNAPRQPGLSEADEAEIDGYLVEMLSLLPVLGIDAFEKAKPATTRRRTYYFTTKGGDATGYETSNGFAVEEGSQARGDTVPSLQEHSRGVYRYRQELIEDGVLVEAGNGYRFALDHEFTSPSQAAAVCAGRPANGRTSWKTEDGTTLKEHQQCEAQA